VGDCGRSPSAFARWPCGRQPTRLPRRWQSERRSTRPYVVTWRRPTKRRDSLDAFVSQLEPNRFALPRVALDSVRAYLPERVLSGTAPPIYILLFENNGFGGAEISLDLLRMLRDDAVHLHRFLAHELHHSYMQRLPEDVRTLNRSAKRYFADSASGTPSRRSRRS
jgi:hypothetical protein